MRHFVFIPLDGVKRRKAQKYFAERKVIRNFEAELNTARMNERIERRPEIGMWKFRISTWTAYNTAHAIGLLYPQSPYLFLGMGKGMWYIPKRGLFVCFQLKRYLPQPLFRRLTIAPRFFMKPKNDYNFGAGWPRKDGMKNKKKLLNWGIRGLLCVGAFAFGLFAKMSEETSESVESSRVSVERLTEKLHHTMDSIAVAKQQHNMTRPNQNN